jgi:hypothetical protein
MTTMLITRAHTLHSVTGQGISVVFSEAMLAAAAAPVPAPARAPPVPAGCVGVIMLAMIDETCDCVVYCVAH